MTTNIGGVALVALAKAIATWAHLGQFDKNGHDYIDHPKSVFYRVYADDEWDYDGQVVAWLHDVVEDTKVTLDDLRAFFPEYIVEAVAAISFRIYDPEETRSAYYLRVKVNPISKRVKLKDMEHNSSPKRLEKLPKEDQIRLLAKYEKGRREIMS